MHIRDFTWYTPLLQEDHSKVSKIFVSNNHVVMYFEGEKKPVISAPHNEEFDLEKGILMCLYKHEIGGGNTKLQKLVGMAKNYDKKDNK